MYQTTEIRVFSGKGVKDRIPCSDTMLSIVFLIRIITFRE